MTEPTKGYRTMRWTPRPLTLVALLSLLTACGNSPAPDRQASEERAPEVVCPQRWEGAREPWVPREPSSDLRDALVPAQSPTQAVLCRYDGSNLDSFKGASLSWRGEPSAGVLAKGLDGLRRLSAANPGQRMVCTLMGGPQRNYLLGLGYRDGDVVWVFGADDPNSCVPTSNGRFTTQKSAKKIFQTLNTSTDGSSVDPPAM